MVARADWRRPGAEGLVGPLQCLGEYQSKKRCKVLIGDYGPERWYGLMAVALLAVLDPEVVSGSDPRLANVVRLMLHSLLRDRRIIS